jgi:hypothetical protein
MKQVKTFARIEKLAGERKACLRYVPAGKDNIIPAAMILGMPARVVWGWLKHGHLFEYVKGSLKK